MGKPKLLSATQIKVLRALAEPGAVARYVFSMTGGYYGLGTTAIKATLMAKLAELKLAQRFPGKHQITATITQAGRDYLASLEGKADEK